HERLGSFLKNSLVAPVGDAFPDEDVAAYEPLATEALTVGGARYAVPLASKCLALFVNEELLPRGPDSLEELEEMRDALPEGSYPLAYEVEKAYFHAPFLHAFGGRMLGDAEDFAMVGDAAARSVEFVRSLWKDKVVPDEPNDALVQQLF